MQSYKSERQRQLDNVQKQLLTNYYLQKYNSMMSGIFKQPENKQRVETIVKPKEPEIKSQRMNFKNMILMKKNQNQNVVKRTPKISNQQPQLEKSGSSQIVHKYSSREQQQNQKTIKKLEQSIINQLYRISPSKIQQGSYNKLEISNSYHKKMESTTKRYELDPVPQQNIEVTYEEDHQINEFYEDEQEHERVNAIKQAIKLEFDRRKEHFFSPNKQSRKNSDAKSSKISAQIKIQSPKRLQKAITPNKHAKLKQSKARQKGTKNVNHQSSSQELSQDHDDSLKRKRFQSISSQKKSHQIYFSEDIPTPISGYLHEPPNNDEVKQEQIQFVPPTSNYYMSKNDNLVQESFKYQQEIRQNKDRDSEKAHSVASSRKSSVNKKMMRNDSKRSIRSRKKSEHKDNSRMEMSFVSKMSMLSSNEGFLIKEKIQKQLYDNELGPYQSALFNVIELMDSFPKSGAIYAVGQKTLDDRKAFQQRRANQESEISQLKRNIQKIKKKSQIKSAERQQQTIIRNQLQILRLIRKLSTTL